MIWFDRWFTEVKHDYFKFISFYYARGRVACDLSVSHVDSLCLGRMYDRGCEV